MLKGIQYKTDPLVIVSDTPFILSGYGPVECRYDHDGDVPGVLDVVAPWNNSGFRNKRGRDSVVTLKMKGQEIS